MFGITDISPLPISMIALMFTRKPGAGTSPAISSRPASISIRPKIINIIDVTFATAWSAGD